MRRLAACTGLRAGAFLAAGLTVGLPTVFNVGLLVGLLGFGVDLTDVLAADLVAGFAEGLAAVLAGALADGLVDLAGAFNAGLALAAD